MDTKPPKLYLIPGTGADGRLFEGLRRKGLDFEVLEFIPALPKETLRAYSLRLAEGIDRSQPFMIGGVSLGGVMAVEIAHAIENKGLILISSVKNSKEFPLYFRLGRWIPMHLLVSGGFMRRHGPRASLKGMAPWQAKILRDLRTDADEDFVAWAVNALIHWRRRELPAKVLHIHGTRDFMLPGIFLANRVRIRGGRHVMVVTHAPEIVREIQQFIQAQTALADDHPAHMDAIGS
jgi:pimeloyl-ACP methyl ester carboxylesterase